MNIVLMGLQITTRNGVRVARIAKAMEAYHEGAQNQYGCNRTNEEAHVDREGDIKERSDATGLVLQNSGHGNAHIFTVRLKCIRSKRYGFHQDYIQTVAYGLKIEDKGQNVH